MAIYTVPWFPQLMKWPHPEMPGYAVEIVGNAAALMFAALSTPAGRDFDRVVRGIAFALRITPEHAKKAAALALHLGMCGIEADDIRFTSTMS